MVRNGEKTGMSNSQELKTFLEVKDLTVDYGTVRALSDISLQVKQNEIVALLGPNGAGKSTALKAICGFLQPTGGNITSGEVLFEGKSVKNVPTYELVEKGISLVPEGRRVFPTMSVLENLEMGGFTAYDRVMVRDNIEKVFTIFPDLKKRQKQRAGTLSSGEQQMLAMGRALMLKPKLLLLDEPSLGLSPNYVEIVFEKMKEINKNGTTILLVEQNAQIALETAHRGYVFEIGKIVLEDTCKNLLENCEVKKTFLGG